MTIIRLLMSLFLGLVLFVAIAGIVWAERSANVLASRAVLMATVTSAVFALYRLWTWDPDAVSQD